jgi:hypothetical protein
MVSGRAMHMFINIWFPVLDELADCQLVSCINLAGKERRNIIYSS